jgi:hypothetical protein
MWRWVPALSVFLLLGGTAAAQVIDENELVMRMRTAAENCRGAAEATQTRIAGQFYRDHDFRIIQVASAVVTNLSQTSIGDVVGAGYAPCGMTWRFDTNQWSGWHSDFNRVEECRAGGSCYPTAARLLRAGWPPSVRKDYVITAEKSYQDRLVTYSIALPPRAARYLDDLRVGQKITFTMRLFGASPTQISGVLEQLMTETRMLRCPNGHEYAPAAGYKFCPQDGQPLR